MLARELPGVIVIVDEDRVHAAETAALKLAADVAVLDDGFQHRWLHRDVDLVLVPSRDFFVRPALLPAGHLRESMSSLKRADVLIISRLEGNSEFREAAKRARSFAPGKPVVGVAHEGKGLREEQTGAEISVASLPSRDVVAVSAIADPASFGETLVSLGLRPVRHLMMRDHHWFTERDLKSIAETCRREKSQQIVTTQKDAARLRTLDPAVRALLQEFRLYTVVLRMKIVEGEDVLNGMIQDLTEMVRLRTRPDSRTTV